MAQKRAILLVYALSWLGLAALLLAVGAAPLLQERYPRWSAFLYSLFAPLCHQNPERCFRLDGRPLAVCARCLGVYLGFGGGLVLYAFVRGFRSVRLPSRPLFLVASAPTAVDVAGNILGFWASPAGMRFAMAAAWGLILPFFFVTGLVEALARKDLELNPSDKKPKIAARRSGSNGDLGG
ncbi:MAG: DUF2085 domain-containing protein [Candidatus Aminicenantes bacterium]|nr:DUF2085 domain-containing protein [Candidatus Aminicenantes bacterium]